MDAPTRPAGFDQVGPAPVGLGALAGLREAVVVSDSVEMLTLDSRVQFLGELGQY